MIVIMRDYIPYVKRNALIMLVETLCFFRMVDTMYTVAR